MRFSKFLPKSLFTLMGIGLFLIPVLAEAGAVITGTLGADSRDHFKGGHFGYSVGLYAKFDEQTLIGIQSGQGSPAGTSTLPVLASGMFRLPFGRVTLPVLAGDIGYAWDDSHNGLLWRGGGGFDIRNGRRSSILALGFYERFGSKVGWCGRAGLLLEF